MEMIAQKESIAELKNLASYDRHSVMIAGVSGCGKTYLAKQYANMLNIEEFQMIEPKVQAIKATIQDCIALNNPIVLCIENLDTGVPGASYALLKFLEEPKSNIYIVVTCRNIRLVPDTIVSRSAVISVAPPVNSDIHSFAKSINELAYERTKSNSAIWKCVKTLSDVELVLNMTPTQISYFNTIPEIIRCKDPISSVSWQLQNYPNDGGATPIELVVRYIMNTVHSKYLWTKCHECLQDLSRKRISANAVISKLVFELKYCE